ncbi:MAG: hemerythrin family protein [Massilia sp.]
MRESHERINGAIEQLSRAPDRQFGADFQALVDMLEIAFRAEESAMETRNYRALRNHREQHARVLATMHQIEPRVVLGDVRLGRDALDLLPQWLDLHHSSMDLAVVAALQRCRWRGKPRAGDRGPAHPPASGKTDTWRQQPYA